MEHHHSGIVSGSHEGHHTRGFLSLFWLSLFLTIPVFFYSEMAMDLFNIHTPKFLGWQYVVLLCGSIIYFYCGWVFIQGAYRELRARLPGMMTLITIAITTAYIYSVVSVLAGVGHDLLFELSSLVTVMLLGHWIEMRAVAGVQGALKEISELLPDTVEMFHSGMVMTMPLAQIEVGNIVLVRPGARVPADGLIIEGRSDVDESIITGESKPIPKEVGSEVVAGSINGDGNLKVRVVKIGEETFLAGIARLVRDAQNSKSKLQILSDRAARYLTFIALGAGFVTFVTWLFVGAGVVTATERLVAVLVIACPHALGLAVPLVASLSTTIAARNGFLVRQRLALESARTITTVVFDKTGTLTEGKFSVTQSSSDEALLLAASVNIYSEHPIARALVAEARKRGFKLLDVTDSKRIPGRGVEGVVGDANIFVGTKGGDEIVVERDGGTLGTISVADSVRLEAYEAVTRLKEQGINVVMITGDSEESAQMVAGELGIEKYFARVLPEDKVKKVQELQSRGGGVAMVGDGVNDAPALAQADLGIAIGAGTNVAIESAGIVLIKNDPRDIPKIINLSKATYAKMIQNLVWAAGYNVVAIPLAGGVLASQGVLLQPTVAAILMSASTVIVAVNAMLLKGERG